MSSEQKEQGPSAVKSEYAFAPNQLKPTAVASQYAVAGLENVVRLDGNPIYQRQPHLAKSNHLVPGAGVPLSAAAIREKVATLEEKVYVPTICDGKLYFVSGDDDTRTAREPGHALPEKTYTLSQLKQLLGAGIEEKLANLTPMSITGSDVSSWMSQLTGDERTTRTAASRTMLTGEERTDSAITARSAESLCTQTAASRTMLTGEERSDQAVTAASRTMLTGEERSDQAVTAASRTMLTGEERSDQAVTAASRTMLTGEERSDQAVTTASRTMLTGEERSDQAVTALSDGLLTARGSEPNLRKTVPSTTGVPTFLLTHTPSNDPRAASAAPSIDTMRGGGGGSKTFPQAWRILSRTV